MIEAAAPQEHNARAYFWRALAAFLSALTCGITFLLALYRQLALVEVSACVVLGIELYFLAASIGEWIEGNAQPNKKRAWIALALAFLVVCYFLIAKNVPQIGAVE
jgi:hypothetical protein